MCSRVQIHKRQVILLNEKLFYLSVKPLLQTEVIVLLTLSKSMVFFLSKFSFSTMDEIENFQHSVTDDYESGIIPRPLVQWQIYREHLENICWWWVKYVFHDLSVYSEVFYFNLDFSQSPHEAPSMLIQWTRAFCEPPIWVGYFGCSCFDFFPSLWLYGFVHLIKQIPSRCFAII